MRLYTTSSSLLWIGILAVIVLLLTVVGIGGFLLGTPLGLAVLTFFAVRGLYIHYFVKPKQKRQHQSYYDPYEEEAPSQKAREEDYVEQTVVKDESEKFDALYRQNQGSSHVFTADDIRNAQDVEFKEV